MDLQSSHNFPIPEKLHFFPCQLFTRRCVSHALLFISSLTILIIFCNLISPFQPRYLLGIGLLSQILPNNQKATQNLCDHSYGKWVWDENYPFQKYTEKCPFLDPGFRCRQCGRQDLDYQNWRWQPKGCDLPRFNATDLLERSRNRRIVFSGDSITRNQWESLLCMLAQGVSNQSMIYEENGSPITKHKGFLSMRFQEYNLTVEYYRMPFLVLLERPPQNASKEVKGVIRVDKLHWYCSKWIGADVLIFSPGHWWNEAKTIKTGIYFMEGEAVNMTMDPMEAFRRSLNTWKLWITQNLAAQRSRIIFRSYSPLHYRDGSWNDGGLCDTNTAPETNFTKLEPEPLQNKYISEVVKQMKSIDRGVQYLDITYLTEFRQDGHPSKHREPGTPLDAPQDCSHWCLPGVPDTWNELLYAYLVSEGFGT